MTKPAGEPRRFARLLRGSLRFLAYAYPLTLMAVCAAFLLVGEDAWLTTGLLYAPRALFGAPLSLLVPALWAAGLKRLLWTQLLALLLTLFPLMGLVLPWPVESPRGPTLRVLSYNVDTAHAGTERLLAEVDRLQPDLVLFQEAPWGGPILDRLRTRYPHVENSTQFVIASRFPILERTEPAKIPHRGRLRSARFIRYLIDSNLGKLAVYSIHPISPRGAFGVYRTQGLLSGLKRAVTSTGDVENDLRLNAELRELQIAALAAQAQRERVPQLLAGDSNLPGLSAMLRRHLSNYQDGFQSADWGFGYTYPGRRPFLRLDRMLAGPELGFSQFAVDCPGASDHRCVVAQLFRR